MVVTVVIAILASLTFTGLTVARNRAKTDKTRSTIRKIHEIIVPVYESYAQRRVPFKHSTDRIQNARNRLLAQRLRLVRDMPDTWWDTVSAGTTSAAAISTPLQASGTFTLAETMTGPMQAYMRYRDSLPNLTSGRAAGEKYRAECLAMIVLKGGVPPQDAEQFRADEIGDVDNDGAVEFADGWQKEISFVLWPSTDNGGNYYTTNAIDPMDTLRVSGPGTPPTNTPDPAFTPLIISAGADRAFGLSNIDRQLLDTTGTDANGSWRQAYPKWVQRFTANPPVYTTTQAVVTTYVATGSTTARGITGTIVQSDLDISNLR